LNSRVCAIVVTHNGNDFLRPCLRSLLAQTRPPDCILVVDSASSDSASALLNEEFSGVARIALKEHAGSAGGLTAGLRWAHCNKFQWMWVTDDRTRFRRECLETMLSFGNEGDFIQMRFPVRETPDSIGFVPTDICDFRGALLARNVIDAAGLPDERYFNAGDNFAYGIIASHKARSICLKYAGIESCMPGTRLKKRTDYYLSVRNRFLDRHQLAQHGLAPNAPAFYLRTLLVFLNNLGEAAASSSAVAVNAMAAIDGLRDGLHKRFDRIPRL
jgi:glycosyltransferase involved in cell wall biosynthesis